MFVLRGMQLGPIRHCLSPKKEGKEQREREKKGPAHFWRSVARFRALGKRLFWNLETEAQKNEVERTEFV